MIGILETIREFLRNQNGFWVLMSAPFLFLVTTVIGIFKWLHTLLFAALDKIDSFLPSMVFGFGDPDFGVATNLFVTINTFIPLDLIFELSAFFLLLHGICATIRIIKAWIPTVS